jgi:hypothetical protein
VFKKDNKHIFYDGILFASFGYCITFVILGFPPASYYGVPAIILFFIVLAYWVEIFYYTKKIYYNISCSSCYFLFVVKGNG